MGRTVAWLLGDTNDGRPDPLLRRRCLAAPGRADLDGDPTAITIEGVGLERSPPRRACGLVEQRALGPLGQRWGWTGADRWQAA